MRVRIGMLLSLFVCATFLGGGASSALGSGTRLAPSERIMVSRPVLPAGFCSGVGAHSFVGGKDGNVAAGADSGVLSGQNNSACGPQTAIGTGGHNVAFSTASGAFIAAGDSNNAQTGYSAFIGAGMSNSTTSDWDTILGGAANHISQPRGVILGGLSNIVAEYEGFVGGGAHNSVTGGSVVGDAVAGGQSNGITTGLGASFIGGGNTNTITGATSGSTAVIFGGTNNTVHFPKENTDCSHGAGCQTIGAGHDNQANDFAATVLGGAGNVAGGMGSFAAGIRAWAANRGAFVWADDAPGAPTLKSSADNQFLARASGGFFLYTNASNTVGAELPAGSGTWSSISDRSFKQHITPIDTAAVLARVASLPITQWSYRSEGGVRHIGPMAQDFSAAFHIGEDARHITSLDEAGVALAAVQALDAKTGALGAVLGGRSAPVPRSASARAVRPNVPTCSGKGFDAFVGGNDGNVAGGPESGVLSGQKNKACDGATGIGGGGTNAIGTSQGGAAQNSFIGGGFYSSSNNEPNVITVVGGLATDSFIGAGNDNLVQNSESAIGGGEHNDMSATMSFLGGGLKNAISATHTDAFLGGGDAGTAQGDYAVLMSSALGPAGASAVSNYGFLGGGAGQDVIGDYAAIGGGEDNTAFGKLSVIEGGFHNRSDGEFSVVAGGWQNASAGSLSFAAGYNTDAATPGSFAWGDDFFGASPVQATLNDEFVARASGGYTLYTNASDTVGATLASGSGTWGSLSDRHVKRDIVPVDGATILAALQRLPIRLWSYRSEPSVRHLGPMAQDFYAAFGVGEDNRHITMIDEDGAALAAVKALAPRIASLRARAKAADIQLTWVNAVDRATIAILQKRVADLQAAVRSARRAGREK